MILDESFDELLDEMLDEILDESGRLTARRNLQACPGHIPGIGGFPGVSRRGARRVSP